MSKTRGLSGAQAEAAERARMQGHELTAWRLLGDDPDQIIRNECRLCLRGVAVGLDDLRVFGPVADRLCPGRVTDADQQRMLSAAVLADIDRNIDLLQNALRAYRHGVEEEYVKGVNTLVVGPLLAAYQHLSKLRGDLGTPDETREYLPGD
jgi:hypothetical protein